MNSAVGSYCLPTVKWYIGKSRILPAGPTGYVTIENIKAGDLVWAHDPETGETALKPVVQTFRNETKEKLDMFPQRMQAIICLELQLEDT